jgi:ribosomal protein L7/L12
MNQGLTPEQTREIAEVLAEGRKIEAIKLYREATGRGLAEAKAFVDALIPRLLEEDPEKFAALAGKGEGCTASASVLLLLVLAGALLLGAVGG